MRREKILIVDDEPRIVSFVKAYLEREGYPTLEAGDGLKALELWREQRPDLIILDVLMPRLDGLEFCREVRRESNVPIVILSARSDEDDRILGLELGADDYVVKPFSPRELVARVRSLLRRRSEGAGDEDNIVAGPLTVEGRGHRATLNGEEVPLTPMEFAVLKALASHPGMVLSREQIIRMTQGDYYEGYDRNIDTHVKNIRRKLEGKEGGWTFIETVHRVGYRFRAKERKEKV
ncbi:MAG: response regulator transcription factor [Actinobacteria bacterium]|nr:response regulator transcription factor [Actinomycetota bacterium]